MNNSIQRSNRNTHKAFALALCVFLTGFSTAAPTSSIGLMEEGKALFESGRYMDSLGKFMLVLRSDPQNAEARQYLRQVVDQMRQNPAAASSRRNPAGGSNASAQTEMRGMMQKRAAMTLDLKAIPGVKVESEGSLNQAIIETNRLFPDNAGGLKEEGIPIMDRVSAWLKTYGAQPVFIHSYPEELGDAATQGPLFLRRYSELYNFFVQERKIPAERFISTDAIVDQNGASKPVAASATGATGSPRVVIEVVGSQASLLEGGMPTGNTRTAIARWLEFAVIVMRDLFTPEEGEWSSIDIVALTRTGLRSWDFKIEPETKGKPPVLALSGQGNILKRLSWDGRDAKTGSFVPSGTYVARLTATDSDGTIKTEQAIVRVQRLTADEPMPVVAAKPKPKPTPKAKPKVEKPVTAETPEDPLLADAPAEEPEPVSGNASHEIWKQVIPFESESDDLSAATKTSLERIGKTLDVYPLQKVRITGFAAASESGATQMAKRRAEAVKRALIEEYLIDAKRITLGATKVKSGGDMSKVELSITN